MYGGAACLVTKSRQTPVTPWTVACQNPLVRGIFQARILEWVAILFYRGSPRPRDLTQVSCITGRFFTTWATREGKFYKMYIVIQIELE